MKRDQPNDRSAVVGRQAGLIKSAPEEAPDEAEPKGAQSLGRATNKESFSR